MSDVAPVMTRDQISAVIAEKAWKDESFHKAVLANPNKVFEEHTGQPLPQGMTIKVIEDTPNTVHFVIPARPASTSELSDAELESVAGGTSPVMSLIWSAAGATLVSLFVTQQDVTKKPAW